jgi:hypothetical protein
VNRPPAKWPSLKSAAPRHLAILTVILLAACNPMAEDFMGPEGCLFPCSAPAPEPLAFAVSPDSANILLGDSLRLNSWNCPAGGCLFGNPVVSNWTISGDAVVAAAGTSSSLLSVSAVVLRAAGAGEAMITAVASTDSARRQTVRLHVADSSAITTLGLSTCCAGPDTVVADGDVLSYMKDQAGRRYRAQPTDWSLSDSTLVTLGASRFGAGARSIRVRKTGVVVIRARFLGVEDTLRVVVRP